MTANHRQRAYIHPIILLATLGYLLAAMLVAVKAGGSEVRNAVTPAVALWVLVFQRRPRRTGFCKGSLAIAAAPLLLLDEACPQAARVFAVESHRLRLLSARP